MELFEEKYIYRLINNLKLKSIDQMFLIRIGTLDKLVKFKEQVHTFHLTIHFLFEYSLKGINSLN